MFSSLAARTAPFLNGLNVNVGNCYLDTLKVLVSYGGAFDTLKVSERPLETSPVSLNVKRWCCTYTYLDVLTIVHPGRAVCFLVGSGPVAKAEAKRV